MNPRHSSRTYLPSILAFFLLTAFLLTTLACPSGDRRRVWESAAKATLHSLSTAQAAYQANYATYGTFDELLAAQYIAQQGFTLETMIDEYTLTWEISYDTEADDSEPDDETPADEEEPVEEETPVDLAPDDLVETTLVFDQFTIIARPEPHQPPLRTYGITEDFILRVYSPDSGNDLEDVHTWDPVP